MSKREAYVEKFKAKLDEWNAEISKMEAKAKGAGADSKLKYEEQITEVKSRRDKARDRLKEVRESSDEAWEDLKAGADQAWKSVSDAVTEAWSRFK